MQDHEMPQCTLAVSSTRAVLAQCFFHIKVKFHDFFFSKQVSEATFVFGFTSYKDLYYEV